MLTAQAVNKPELLDTRRKELRAKLSNDPSAPEQPKFTHQEMRDAASRLMASVLTTGKLKLPS